FRPGDRARPAARGPGRPAGRRRLSRQRRPGRADEAAGGRSRVGPSGGIMSDFLFFIEVTLAGLGSGALLSLVALAFVLIYKATRVINLAVGEILMMGGYFFFAFAAGWGLSPWIAIPLAVGGGAAIGALVERGVIRR